MSTEKENTDWNVAAFDNGNRTFITLTQAERDAFSEKSEIAGEILVVCYPEAKNDWYAMIDLCLDYSTIQPFVVKTQFDFIEALRLLIPLAHKCRINHLLDAFDEEAYESYKQNGEWKRRHDPNHDPQNVFVNLARIANALEDK